MSRKLVKAANERDQKSILKYTEIKENRNITDSEEGADIVAPTSTERYIKLKDATLTPKRKRSQGYSPNSTENNRPTKFINMSKTLDENTTARTLTPPTQDTDPEDDESTLSPELAKLERILSRKQESSLKEIKRDIKLLLETEEIIKKQQDTIDDLKKENHELNMKCNKLEKNQTMLRKRV